MPHPLGDKRVKVVTLASVNDDPLGQLQTYASNLRHLQLLRLDWAPGDVPENMLEALGMFHAWLPRNIPSDTGSVLHFGPTAQQQGLLHQALQRHRTYGITWQNEHLALVGSYRVPRYAEIVDLIVQNPGITADEVARRLREQHAYDEQDTRNCLRDLSDHRVVARR